VHPVTKACHPIEFDPHKKIPSHLSPSPPALPSFPPLHPPHKTISATSQRNNPWGKHMERGQQPEVCVFYPFMIFKSLCDTSPHLPTATLMKIQSGILHTETCSRCAVILCSKSHPPFY
jgi:hypothetical protein